MTMRPLTGPSRRAFTLTEMLVVLSIIFTLVGLLLAGVNAASGRAKEVQIRNDVAQLDAALGSFKTEFGIYPPTHLVMSSNYAQTRGVANTLTNAGLMTAAGYVTPPAVTTQQWQAMIDDSTTFFKKMFPRWNPSPVNSMNVPIANGIPAGATNAASNQIRVISGSQVLVFLLGGYSKMNGGTAFDQTASGLGFSDDPANPFGNPAAAGTLTRKRPLYDFPAIRKVVITTQVGPNSNATPFNRADVGFLAFSDPVGMPFLYFASQSGNDYAAASNGYSSTKANSLGGYLSFSFTSAQGTAFTSGAINPYQDANGNYMKPQSFQIVSAGPDGGTVLKGGKGGFGNGGNNWTTGNAQYTRGTNSGFGFDDISNFHGTALGIR